LSHFMCLLCLVMALLRPTACTGRMIQSLNEITMN
jgi:hypothetical protein